jgi:hypothetical protein
MFLIYSQERSEPLAAEEAETVMNNHWALMQDAKQKGVLLGVDALKPTSTATTVRVTNGQALTTDGPFAKPRSNWPVTTCWSARIWTMPSNNR